MNLENKKLKEKILKEISDPIERQEVFKILEGYSIGGKEVLSSFSFKNYFFLFSQFIFYNLLIVSFVYFLKIYMGLNILLSLGIPLYLNLAFSLFLGVRKKSILWTESFLVSGLLSTVFSDIILSPLPLFGNTFIDIVLLFVMLFMGTILSLMFTEPIIRTLLDPYFGKKIIDYSFESFCISGSVANFENKLNEHPILRANLNKETTEYRIYNILSKGIFQFSYPIRTELFILIKDKLIELYTFGYSLSGDKIYRSNFTDKVIDYFTQEMKVLFTLEKGHPKSKKLAEEKIFERYKAKELDEKIKKDIIKLFIITLLIVGFLVLNETLNYWFIKFQDNQPILSWIILAIVLVILVGLVKKWFKKRGLPIE